MNGVFKLEHKTLLTLHHSGLLQLFKTLKVVDKKKTQLNKFQDFILTLVALCSKWFCLLFLN